MKSREKSVTVVPEVVQTILLDEIAERLRSIENMLQKPVGEAYFIMVTVSGLEEIDFISKHPFTPLYSITIFNDGPDEVYPSINTLQKTTPIKPNESVKFDCQAPRIRKLYLYVNGTASIRGIGVY